MMTISVEESRGWNKYTWGGTGYLTLDGANPKVPKLSWT